MTGKLLEAEMIDREKVARAMASIDPNWDDLKWNEIPPRCQGTFLNLADAAIAAVLEQLREPSDGLAGHLVSRANILSASSAWGFDGDAYLMLQAADRIREHDAAFPTRPESDTPAE